MGGQTDRYRAMGSNRTDMDKAIASGNRAEQDRLREEYDQLEAQRGGKQ